MITDINEIKALKAKIEQDIKDTLLNFKNETGCDINVNAYTYDKTYTGAYTDKVVKTGDDINISLSVHIH